MGDGWRRKKEKNREGRKEKGRCGWLVPGGSEGVKLEEGEKMRKGEGKNWGVFSRIFAGEELSRCVLCGFFFSSSVHVFHYIFIFMHLPCCFSFHSPFECDCYAIFSFYVISLEAITYTGSYASYYPTFFFCHTCYFKLVSSLLGCEARNGKCWVAFTKNELWIPLLLLLVRVGYVHGGAVLREKKKLRGREENKRELNTWRSEAWNEGGPNLVNSFPFFPFSHTTIKPIFSHYFLHLNRFQFSFTRVQSTFPF